MSLTPCDKEVFEKGECVFRTYTIPAELMELWVQKLALLSGQRVDWHFDGGRVRVLALGDLDKVRDAINQLKPEHDDMFRVASDSYLEPTSGELLIGVKEQCP